MLAVSMWRKVRRRPFASSSVSFFLLLLPLYKPRWGEVGLLTSLLLLLLPQLQRWGQEVERQPPWQLMPLRRVCRHAAAATGLPAKQSKGPVPHPVCCIPWSYWQWQKGRSGCGRWRAIPKSSSGSAVFRDAAIELLPND